MKHKPPRISLIERALIERQWHETAVSAQIHALIGDDSDRMVDGAGRVLYVVLGAAMAEGISADQSEIRVIRGAVNAVHDQAGETEIPATRRRSIQIGLEAAGRLIPALGRRSLIDAACDLTVKMKTQHIRLSDFHEVIA